MPRASWEPGTVLGAWSASSHLIFIVTLWSKHRHHPHLMDERAEAQRNEGSFPRPSELLPFESRAHPLNRQSLAYPGIKWESCPHFGSCSFHVEHRRLTNDRQNSSRELSSLGAHICEELSGGKRSICSIWERSILVWSGTVWQMASKEHIYLLVRCMQPNCLKTILKEE